MFSLNGVTCIRHYSRKISYHEILYLFADKNGCFSMINCKISSVSFSVQIKMYHFHLQCQVVTWPRQSSPLMCQSVWHFYYKITSEKPPQEGVIWEDFPGLGVCMRCVSCEMKVFSGYRGKAASVTFEAALLSSSSSSEAPLHLKWVSSPFLLY